MKGPIIVGLDGRPAAHDALELAAELCEQTGTGLIVAHVPASAHPFTPYDQHSQRQLRNRIHELRPELAPYLERVPPGRRRDVRAFHGLTAAAGLAELAGSERASLIIVGSTHHTPVGRLLLGSTASQLLLQAPCPVVVAPRGGHAAVGTIGVAVDAGHSSDEAVRRARELADELGAELHELHVDEGSTVHTLAHASKELDLLVVGCREGGGLVGHPTLTSVSRRLLERSDSPLMVVPEVLT